MCPAPSAAVPSTPSRSSHRRTYSWSKKVCMFCLMSTPLLTTNPSPVPLRPPPYSQASSSSLPPPSWSRGHSAESPPLGNPPAPDSPSRPSSARPLTTASPPVLAATGSGEHILTTLSEDDLFPPAPSLAYRPLSSSPPAPVSVSAGTGSSIGASGFLSSEAPLLSTSLDSQQRQGAGGGLEASASVGLLQRSLLEAAEGARDEGGARQREDFPWPGIWRLVGVAESIEPDKQVSSHPS